MNYTRRGTCSTFGGPHDTGVGAAEDLALYEHADVAKAPDGLFLEKQPAGTTGTARRLNPAALYCAMRFAYTQQMRGTHKPGLGTCLDVVTSRAWLHQHPLLVSNPKHPNLPPIEVHAVDWGPNSDTGRIIDLSPGAAAALGVQTDDEVIVTIPIPVSNE